MTKEADTKRIIEETIKKYGKLDILVNNAGILETNSILKTSLDQYDRIMNTNVRQVLQLTLIDFHFRGKGFSLFLCSKTDQGPNPPQILQNNCEHKTYKKN